MFVLLKCRMWNVCIFNDFKLILFHFLLLWYENHIHRWTYIQLDHMQIGTNNCTARYRTLSGGIGESPSLSPSPSSDYEDDETITKQHLPNLSIIKRNGNHKGAVISQKVTVHHVSTFNFNAYSFLYGIRWNVHVWRTWNVSVSTRIEKHK